MLKNWHCIILPQEGGTIQIINDSYNTRFFFKKSERERQKVRARYFVEQSEVFISQSDIMTEAIQLFLTICYHLSYNFAKNIFFLLWNSLLSFYLILRMLEKIFQIYLGGVLYLILILEGVEGDSAGIVLCCLCFHQPRANSWRQTRGVMLPSRNVLRLFSLCRMGVDAACAWCNWPTGRHFETPGDHPSLPPLDGLAISGFLLVWSSLNTCC